MTDKPLEGKDFTEHRTEGVIQGWSYEDDRYRVAIDKSWGGCNIHVVFKHHATQEPTSHVTASEPSFKDQDVITALAIANATLVEQNYGLKEEGR